MNAVGVGVNTSKAMTAYRSSPSCAIESLYLRKNPIDDAGTRALAEGLQCNCPLHRILVASCGINTNGVRNILESLKELITLHVGQNFAKSHLGMGYDFIQDDVTDNLTSFITSAPKSLRMLELGTTGMTLQTVEKMAHVVAQSQSLVVFTAKRAYGKVHAETKEMVNNWLKRYVQALYEMAIEHFNAEEKKWLISPKM